MASCRSRSLEVFNQATQGANGNRSGIRELLTEGQELIVRSRRKNAATRAPRLRRVSLAGRSSLMPNNPRAGGVSRRIEGDDRELLREAMDNLRSRRHGRNRAHGRRRATAEELQWDLNNLVDVWNAIKQAHEGRSARSDLPGEQAILRALRDYLSDDIGEILIDKRKSARGAGAAALHADEHAAAEVLRRSCRCSRCRSKARSSRRIRIR
jgi:ribonuclease E